MIFMFVLIELSSWISRATNNRLLMFQINVDKYLSNYFLSVDDPIIFFLLQYIAFERDIKF